MSPSLHNIIMHAMCIDYLLHIAWPNKATPVHITVIVVEPHPVCLLFTDLPQWLIEVCLLHK